MRWKHLKRSANGLNIMKRNLVIRTICSVDVCKHYTNMAVATHIDSLACKCVLFPRDAPETFLTQQNNNLALSHKPHF